MLNGKIVDPANLPSQIDSDSLDDLDVLSDFDSDDGSADDEITLASERSSGNVGKDALLSLPQSAIALTSVIDSEADITEESIDFVDDDLTGAATPSEAGHTSSKPAPAAKEVDTNQAILFRGIAHRTYVRFPIRPARTHPTRVPAAGKPSFSTYTPASSCSRRSAAAGRTSAPPSSPRTSARTPRGPPRRRAGRCTTSP